MAGRVSDIDIADGVDSDRPRYQVAIVFMLFFVWGLSPWLLVNGLFNELPILVNETPERLQIASFLVVAVQLGNAVAFTYALVQSYYYVRPIITLSITMSTAIVAGVLISFLWDTRTEMASGQQNSTALLVLAVVTGIVGCLSVVVAFPYASLYGITFISAFSAGSGSNGLLTSILEVIQRADQPQPLFEVQTYFLILSGVLVLSSLCFFLIPRSWQITPTQNDQPSTPLLKIEGSDPNHSIKVDTFSSKSRHIAWLIVVPLIHQCYISTLSYALLGTLPYTVAGQPQGVNRSLLLWTTFTGIFLNAVGRITTVFLRVGNLWIQSGAQTVLWIFVFSMVFVQPTDMGWAIPTIIAYSVYSFLFGYEDTLNFQLVVGMLQPHQVEKGSRMMGLSNQVGSMIGSFIGFALARTVLQT